MTVNEFVRRIQTKASMLSTGDIPIKFNGKDVECVIELIESGKGYYINIKQPTKDLALTLEDVAYIVDTFYAVEGSVKEKCEEVLRRFNGKQ